MHKPYNTNLYLSLITALILLFAGINAEASPAKPGPITLVQPDGYVFTAFLKGDEFWHVLTLGDGSAIIRDSDGYYSYAVFDDSGARGSSGVHVGEKGGIIVASSSKMIPYSAISRRAAQKRAIAQKEEEPFMTCLRRSQGVSTRSDSGQVVEKHGLVILAAFSDMQFQFTKENFQAMLSQEGYDYNGATGSAKEYFDAQFGGTVNFSFTVSDIVTLPQTRAYYGGNDSYGDDEHPAEMIRDACNLAHDAGIDFSSFDDDSDSEVDNVFVFFAGGDEAQGDDSDCIWSHSWYLKDGAGISLVLDGVTINRYACTSELTITGSSGGSYVYEMAGIGTFCHEYSHTFGLPDFYDTDYGSPRAAGLWIYTSLMDGGNYNNGGNTPPYFNAIEREFLGLSEPEELVEGIYILEPINLNNRYLRMDTDTEGEYYLFECRSNEGWDSYINNNYKDSAAHGLLIYHIDKSGTRTVYSDSYDRNTTPADRWTLYNEVNANSSHQCADLVEADGRSDQILVDDDLYINLKGLFFPAGGTEFSYYSTPAFSFWSGGDSDLSLTDIALDDDGNVTFSVVSLVETGTPTAIDIKTDVFQDAAIVSWKSSLTSRKIAYATISGFDETFEVIPYATSTYCLVCEHFSPGTSYTATIWYEDSEGVQGEPSSKTFTTLSVSPGSYAYIYFGDAVNEDGTFYTGVKIPLRIFNAVDALSVVWQYGGAEISVGDDGYYELESSGTLKATIAYEGTQEIINRRITTVTPPEEPEE